MGKNRNAARLLLHLRIYITAVFPKSCMHIYHIFKELYISLRGKTDKKNKAGV